MDSVLIINSFVAPPEIFNPKMRQSKFLLFLNANGISYEVCKMLKGERLINKIDTATDGSLCISLSYASCFFRMQNHSWGLQFTFI